MEPLVRAVAGELLPLLDRPFSIFGHSMGAIVGFELARLLRRSYDLEPLHLFVSGCSAPQYPESRPPFHNLPRADLLRELRRLGGMPQQVFHEEDLIDLMLPTLRADFEVLETYSYEAEPPLGCPVSAFGGLEDGYAGREGLEAWRAQTSSRFSLRMFNGDHFFLQSGEGSLVAAISRDLHPHYSDEGHMTSLLSLHAD
jgi:medium-chain acyl-[acyl-carrier-protein] hydrolase